MAGATSRIDLNFIQALFASGAFDGVDAVSVHPYRQTNPETAVGEYAKLRALIARYTPPGQMPLPIVCSEWGYSTAWKQVSDDQQARYAVRWHGRLLRAVRVH